MKTKCPVCEERRGKRRCLLNGMAEICPLCCVEIRREETCGECEHFIAALKHQITLRARPSYKDRKFIFELNPEVDSAVDEAIQQADRGEFSRAMEELKALRLAHPRIQSICYGIGVIHALQGEPDLSIPWFDKAIEIYPYFVEAHYNRAVAYKELLEIGPAMRGFQDVLEIADPSDHAYRESRSLVDSFAKFIREKNGVDLDAYLDSDAGFSRANTLMENRDWSGAIMEFRRCAAKVERHAPTHGNLGLCLAQLGRKADALAALDRALEIDPTYQPAIQNREVVQKMQEGQPLDVPFEIVDYARQRLLREPS